MIAAFVVVEYMVRHFVVNIVVVIYCRFMVLCHIFCAVCLTVCVSGRGTQLKIIKLSIILSSFQMELMEIPSLDWMQGP